MDSRPAAVLGLAVLLLTAGCLGAVIPGTAAETTAEPPAQTPSVSVSATGSAAVEPDQAVVTVAVETTAGSAEEARSQVATDVAAVREALVGLGIDEDAVTTAYYRLDPQYDHTRESRELVGYRAVHALTIDAGVDEAGAVVDAAVGAGADRVDGVQFTLTDDRRQAAREQALGDAMSGAAGDAAAVADASELTIDGVHSVSTGEPAVIPFDGRVAVAEDGADSTTIESGPVTVRATVHVVYSVS